MLKYGYEFFKSWDIQFSVPTFDFKFFVAIPRANKERLIIERNQLGQIIHSKVPEIYA